MSDLLIHVEEEEALRGKLMKILEGQTFLQQRWIPKLVTIAGQEKASVGIWTHVFLAQYDLMQELSVEARVVFKLSGVLRCSRELLGAFTRTDEIRDAAWEELNSIGNLG